MATLYAENVPDDLYEALRQQAKRENRSIAAEVIHILAQMVPTPAELERRRKIFEEIEAIRDRSTMDPGFSIEEAIREDRER
jgi:plasmid stability protein